MKQTITLLIGLALAGSALTVSAQQGPGRGAGAGGPHRHGAQQLPPPISAVLDTDSNGVLSAAEMAQATSQLLKLDQNQDSQLMAEELCPGGFGRGGQGCPKGGQGQGRGACASGKQSVLLSLFDTDKDGTLSAAEINAAPATLTALDKNGDGQVTSDEIRPLQGRGQGRGCRWGQNQPQCISDRQPREPGGHSDFAWLPQFDPKSSRKPLCRIWPRPTRGRHRSLLHCNSRDCPQAARKPNGRSAGRKMRDIKIDRHPIFLSR